MDPEDRPRRKQEVQGIQVQTNLLDVLIPKIHHLFELIKAEETKGKEQEKRTKLEKEEKQAKSSKSAVPSSSEPDTVEAEREKVDRGLRAFEENLNKRVRVRSSSCPGRVSSC